MSDVHSIAKTGFSQSSSIYVSGRPGYPVEIDNWLMNVLGICAGKRVVDLGAGTGKFTPHLFQTGADIIAVEPVLPMLDQLRRAYPEVSAIEGNATHIPLDDESADAIFCAQSFHWFATPEALVEIKRVLKPKGILGLIWNVRDETCAWVAALSRITAKYEDDVPRFCHGHWRRVFPADGYTKLQELTFKHAHNGDFKTVVINRTLSVSFIASLPQHQRENIEQKIRKLLNSCSDLNDETNVSFPYETYLTWTQKE